jgi:hypothetical protein
VVDIPARYTPESRDLPTDEEIASWIETIIRLRDNAEYYERCSRGARARAQACHPDRLALLSRLLRPRRPRAGRDDMPATLPKLTLPLLKTPLQVRMRVILHRFVGKWTFVFRNGLFHFGPYSDQGCNDAWLRLGLDLVHLA